jgi:hypothetical protein
MNDWGNGEPKQYAKKKPNPVTLKTFTAMEPFW